MPVETAGEKSIMSSEGAGSVVMIPTAALVGTGVLVSKGFMWCGKQLKERYERDSQSHTDLMIAVLKEQQAQMTDRKLVVEAMIEQFTASPNLRLSSNVQSQQQQAETEDAIKGMLERARDAMQSSDAINRLKLEHEQAQLRRMLEEEITVSQGIVPTETLAIARAAINRSVQDLRAAQQSLQAILHDAEKQPSASSRLQANRLQQARTTLEIVRSELSLLKGLLQRNYGTIDQRYKYDLETLNNRIQRLDASLQQSKVEAERALAEVRSTQEDVRKLEQKVSTNLLRELEERHERVLEAQGQLDGLKKVVQETRTADIVTSSQGQAILQEIDQLKGQITRMESATDHNLLQRSIDQVTLLRDRVFKLVGEGQQKGVSELISTTLGELGFSSGVSEDNPPIIEKVGASTRIEAQQDGKTVVLYVDRDGGVLYDFSGYQGSACVQEANKIFAALRKKGVFIIDAATERELIEQSDLTPEMLLDDQFAPHFEVNKLQAKISMLLVQVLDKMSFSSISQNASGGSIIIDAINNQDGIGYHIILDRKGDEQVIRGGEDITALSSDTLAREIASLKEQLKADSTEQDQPVQWMTPPPQSSDSDDDTRESQQTDL